MCYSFVPEDFGALLGIMFLKVAPEQGFEKQIQVTVAGALMVNSAAINNVVAVEVLSMLLTGRVAIK